MVFSQYFETVQGKSGRGSKARTQERANNAGRADSTESGRKRHAEHRKHGAEDRKPDRKHHPPKKTPRAPPKPEALELSRRLGDLSRRKKLTETLALYWDKANENIRDAHHACIVVDCCARCGDAAKAEEIVRGVTKDQVTIELRTALMKGYAHAGDMHNAMRVFRESFPSQAATDNAPAKKRRKHLTTQNHHAPNVRTLNTVLRGCLWAAAQETGDGENEGYVVGGVVSSEEAWNMYLKHRRIVAPPDASAYETTVTLLCQALRTEDAQTRIDKFQEQFSIQIEADASVNMDEPEQGVLESLGAMYLSLTRASALLGKWDHVKRTCNRALRAIQASRTILLQGDQTQNNIKSDDPDDAGKKPTTEDGQAKGRKQATMGGKRGRKRDTNDGAAVDRRNASNLKYRLHRLSEMDMELNSLLKGGENKKAEAEGHLDVLQSQISSKLFYFGGGGSTELPAKEGKKKKKNKVRLSVAPNWYSFGLREVLPDAAESNDAAPPETTVQRHRDMFDSNSRLRVDAVFGAADDEKEDSRPLDIELGAGFGDWIVRQAACHSERNHVAVELRADRVHQIFAKAFLTSDKPLANLCVAGAEARDFLGRIPQCTVSTVFVNHPEPPTQTWGEDRTDLKKVLSGESEPAHMLNFANLKAVHSALKIEGKIVIVTDNKFYAKLLCVTLMRLSNEVKKSVRSVHLTDRGFREVEKFGGVIQLYEGQPNEAIGHVGKEAKQGGSSYFDRLWRSGVSNIAQRTARFVIFVERTK